MITNFNQTNMKKQAWSYNNYIIQNKKQMRLAQQQQFSKALPVNRTFYEQKISKTASDKNFFKQSQQQKSNKENNGPQCLDAKNRKLSQDNKFTMLDALKLLSLPLAITLLLLLLFDAYQFSQYLHVSTRMNSNEQADQKQLLYRLEWLTSLTLPVFREYFYEEKVFQLGKLKQWSKLVMEADKALAFRGNYNKFSIHYHKAMALCFMQKFIQCKFAADDALKQASRENIKNLNDIYSILVSNNVMKSSQIPSSLQMLSLSGISTNMADRRSSKTTYQGEQQDMQYIDLQQL